MFEIKSEIRPRFPSFLSSDKTMKWREKIRAKGERQTKFSSPSLVTELRFSLFDRGPRNNAPERERERERKKERKRNRGTRSLSGVRNRTMFAESGPNLHESRCSYATRDEGRDWPFHLNFKYFSNQF